MLTTMGPLRSEQDPSKRHWKNPERKNLQIFHHFLLRVIPMTLILFVVQISLRLKRFLPKIANLRCNITVSKCMCVCVCVCVCESCSVVSNSATPWTVVHGILQARILEWIDFPFSRGSSQPRDQTRPPTLQADSLPAEPQPLRNVPTCRGQVGHLGPIEGWSRSAGTKRLS